MTLVDEKQLALTNHIFFAVNSTFKDIPIRLELLKNNVTLFYGCSSEEQLRENKELYECLMSIENCVIYTNIDYFQEDYYKLAKVFSVHAQMHSLITNISQLIVQNGAMQKICDEIALAFDAPVAINDNAFNLLSYSLTKTRSTDLARIEMSNNELEQKTINALYQSGVLNRLIYSQDPIRFNAMGESAYIIAIRSNGMVMASMTLFEENETVDPLTIEYLPDIANLISSMLHNQNLPSVNKYNNIPYLLQHLLNLKKDNVPKFEDMRNRFLMFDYYLRPNMFLIFIDGVRSSIPEASLRQAADSFHSVFRNSCFMVENDGILFLVSRNDDEVINEKEIRRWNTRLLAAGYYAGVSTVFSDFNSFHLHYEEARIACSMNISTESDLRIFTYDDHRSDHIIDVLKNSADDPGIFIHPGMKKLHESDLINGTDLCLTLFKYLSFPKELDRICAELFIHKNTLFYRMNKIREITGCDMYNGEEILQMMISYRLLKIDS